LATVKTNENGEYSYSWIPTATGQYTIRVSWKGDYGHEGASNTAELTVEKASSLITLTLSSYTAKMGDTVNVNGILYPAKATQITIEYTLPNGTITSKIVDSDSAGVFSDAFAANQVGVWQIKASWIGDDTYAGTTASVSVTVQAVDQTTLILAMAGLGLGVVALILAVIGVMASRKKTAKQPPPAEAPPSTPA
jgi:hypothetical protein